MLILLFHLSYSQYPVKRLYRGDSVVMMKVSQADTINLLFNSYNNTISTLKDSLTIKKQKYDSLYQTIYQTKDSFYNWKWKYEANRNSYIAREAEKEKDKKYDFAQKVILIGIIFLQFQSLK